MGLSELNLALKADESQVNDQGKTSRSLFCTPRQDDRAQLKCLKVNNELMKYCLL